MKHTCHVDAAADDFFSLGNVTRKALTSQCTRIQRRFSFSNNTIDRHLFTRLYNDCRSDRDLIRIDLLQLSVTLYIRVIRTDIHQVTDISSALSNCIALEQLADLIKQHNSYTFLIIAKQNGADSRDRHQKVFIKYLLIADTFPRLFQNIVSDHQVRNHK